MCSAGRCEHSPSFSLIDAFGKVGSRLIEVSKHAFPYRFHVLLSIFSQFILVRGNFRNKFEKLRSEICFFLTAVTEYSLRYQGHIVFGKCHRSPEPSNSLTLSLTNRSMFVRKRTSNGKNKCGDSSLRSE